MLKAISSIARSDAAPPRVVIVGAGFGGLWAAKALANAPVEVVVIDRENYHLFQPLLYQVATAGLSPADIAAPIRGIVGAYRNVTVMLGEVVGIDVVARAVLIMGGQHLPYEYLVLATGARHAYFGHDDWEPLAPGLKRIEDATEIRRRILLAFERAENETDADERRRLMNLVIVGGGPTGVELAGAIAELARRALAKDFRNIDPRVARIILVEAGPRLLPSFPENLSADATRRLERLGVEVRLGAPVTAIDPSGVTIGTARIEARTVIWAAGVAASPAGHWIGATCDRVGRIEVVPTSPCRVIRKSSLSAILRWCSMPLASHSRHRSSRQTAGALCRQLIEARLRGTERLEPFRYRDFGNLATIGRKAAVVDFGWLRLRGFLPGWSGPSLTSTF